MKSDDRFDFIREDPKFRTLSSKKRKADIDSRFQSMFTDPIFSDAKKIDKRGRRIVQEKDLIETDEVQDTKTHSGIDIARGIGNEDSSSDSELSSDEDTRDPALHNWNFHVESIAPAADVTPRLALCNFDAEKISVHDLHVLFSSFLPASGAIDSITVYISEFGRERLKHENESGPVGLTREVVSEMEATADSEDELPEQDKEQLRLYQINRLKYYYAVITCDGNSTAEHLYNKCDGIEFESSAIFVDLRFVPESEDFTDVPVKESVTSSDDLSKYKANPFYSKALQHASVDFTWDEDDPRRKKVTRNKCGKDGDMDDFEAFLASSSSESDSDADQGAKSISVDESSARKSDNRNKSITLKLSKEECKKVKTESKRKLLLEEDTSNSDAYRNSRGQLELLMGEDEEDGAKHFNYNKIIKLENMSAKAKKKKKVAAVQVEDTFKMDLADNRFSAVFTASDFAIDPSDPRYKATAAMRQMVQRRQDVRGKMHVAAESKLKSDRESTSSLNRLVSSVKAKSVNRKKAKPK